MTWVHSNKHLNNLDRLVVITVEGSDMTVSVLVARCASPDTNLYRNLPDNGCDAASSTLDLPLESIRSGATINTVEGTVCACDSTSGCNNPESKCM